MEKMWKKLITAIHRQEKEKGKELLRLSEIGLSKLILIILSGVFLLILSMPSAGLSVKKDSTKKSTDKDAAQTDVRDTAAAAMEEYAGKQEKQLEKLLSRVEGIGKVEVMVTIASSEEKKALQQEDSSSDSTSETDSAGGTRSQNSGSSRKEPVLVGEDGKEPYIVQIRPPQVEGVLVVAQGAGTGVVDSEIIAAVEALFPIEAHKIKVMKMGSPQ